MSESPAPVDVSIVLPVYNEAGHLRAEIDRIRLAMDASHHSYELVVVDDGSDRRLRRGARAHRGDPP